MAKRFSYDVKCEYLARDFLENGHGLTLDQINANTPHLAQAIQDAIESYLEFDVLPAPPSAEGEAQP